MEDVQTLGDIAHNLQFVGGALHIGQAPLQEHFAVVHDAYMVADVLQLPEIVGGDQHRGAVLGHIGQQQTPDLAAHDRVQAVHRLVQHQQVRPGADAQMEGRLLLHALGEAPDGALFGQVEDLVEPIKELVVEFGVDPPVVFAHILQGCGGKIEDIVRDGADGGLDLRIFVDFFTVQGDLAAVRAVDAQQAADGGGLARTVGTNQAVDGTLGDGHGKIVQGLEITKGFCDVFQFQHIHSSFCSRAISSRRSTPQRSS